MANYLVYKNQGATRSRPLDEELIERLAYLEAMGITAHVTSGGQPGKGESGPRTGSTRHDHGNSMDADFYIGDRKLDWNNPDDLPIFQEIVSKGKAAGITGIGGADDYMGAGRLHMGMGTPSRWGAGGKAANAPEWLASAYDGTKFDPVAEVVAAAEPRTTPGPLDKPAGNNLQVVAQAPAPATVPKPEEPKSRNGVLVQAYNKLTGSDVQIGDKILGMETDKFTKGAGMLGDFAKTLTESSDELNKQSMANARAAQGRRNDTPIEFALMPTTDFTDRKRKKKGGIGGLGGYFV